MFTSVGRRNYLVDYFALALREVGGLTVGTDANGWAVGLEAVDVPVQVPPINASGYVDALLAVADEHQVTALVPLNDLDILALAPHRMRFLERGVEALVPDETAALMCADKVRTHEALKAADIDTALTWRSVDDYLADPAGVTRLVVKARFGSASVSLEVVDDAMDLKETWERLKRTTTRSFLAGIAHEGATDLVIQEVLPGQEHGLDIVNDLGGRLQQSALKRKLRMRAGETDQAITVAMDGRVSRVTAALSELVGHQGVLDVDLFLSDERAAVLELNPRFGGGYPFSHEAGMDAVTPLVKWLTGDSRASVEPAAVGVLTAKCDRLVSRTSITQTASSVRRQ